MCEGVVQSGPLYDVPKYCDPSAQFAWPSLIECGTQPVQYLILLLASVYVGLCINYFHTIIPPQQCCSTLDSTNIVCSSLT